MKENYIPRLIDSRIDEEMKLFGAVLISGPKWCGKTTTAKQKCESFIDLQDEKRKSDYRKISDMDPSLLLEGETPRLIDEWQTIPDIWDAVRYQVDKRNSSGQFVLTGSVKPDPREIQHTGAGRISRMRMWTLSLFESGISSGSVRLTDLFNGDVKCSNMSFLEFRDVADAIVKGGWPQTRQLNDQNASKMIGLYCASMLETQTNPARGRKLDSRKMKSSLRALSHNILTPASANALIDDMKKNDNVSVSKTTLYSHLETLKNLYVLENVPAWTPKLRTGARVRSSDRICFTDPSLAAFLLDVTPEDLIMDPDMFIRLFKNMAVRDLRVYSQAIDGEVFHYHDSDDLEVDLIVRLWNGRWGAFEVKLTDSWADEGAENLLKLRDKVDASMRPPSFLAVLTATGPAYTRPDGVHVIPLTCLRD